MTKHNHLNILSRIDSNLSAAVKAGDMSNAEFVRVRGLVREEMIRVLGLDDDVDSYTGEKIAPVAAQEVKAAVEKREEDRKTAIANGEKFDLSAFLERQRASVPMWNDDASKARKIGRRFGMRLDCVLSA